MLRVLYFNNNNKHWNQQENDEKTEFEGNNRIYERVSNVWSLTNNCDSSITSTIAMSSHKNSRCEIILCGSFLWNFFFSFTNLNTLLFHVWASMYEYVCNSSTFMDT